MKKKLREKTDRFTNRKRKRVRDLDESDSDIEETSKDQPVLGETENEKLLNQGAQHIWNLEFENLKKKFEIMQAQLEAERAEKEKLAKQIETLKTGLLIFFLFVRIWSSTFICFCSFYLFMYFFFQPKLLPKMTLLLMLMEVSISLLMNILTQPINHYQKPKLKKKNLKRSLIMILTGIW